MSNAELRPLRSLPKALLIFASLTAFQVFAEQRPPDSLYSAGMQLVQIGKAKVVGRDPYIILPLENSAMLSEAVEGSMQIISLDLQIDLESTDYGRPNDVTGELFFRPLSEVQGSEVRGFDPQYKIKFHYPDKDFSAIHFELPKNTELPNKLRLDFDNCSNCLIKHSTSFSLGLLNESRTVIVPDRVFNGSNAVPVGGVDIDPSQWHLNDLERDDYLLNPTGGDPYMISPILDADTDQLAGVLFKLENQNGYPSDQSYQSIFDFQLFYSTEHFGFSEKANSIFRVKTEISDQSAPKSTTQQLSIFVPLKFLARENSKLLKRLRLDFATHSNYSTIERPVTTWNFKSAQLVHTSLETELQEFLPQQIFRNKHTPFSISATISSVYRKLFKDLWFVLAFLALLLICSTLVLRRFRQTLNS